MVALVVPAAQGLETAGAESANGVGSAPAAALSIGISQATRWGGTGVGAFDPSASAEPGLFADAFLSGAQRFAMVSHDKLHAKRGGDSRLKGRQAKKSGKGKRGKGKNKGKKKKKTRVRVDELRFLWTADHENGAARGYGLGIELAGNDIAMGSVETPDGTTLSVADGAAISPLLDLVAFDQSYGSGMYHFSLEGMTGDTLTFSLEVARPSAPIGVVDIDAPLPGATTGPQPSLTWSCAGCDGERLELVVVDRTLEQRVFSGPMTHLPGAGDSRNDSAVPNLLNLGPHIFETVLLNSVETPRRRIHPDEARHYDVFLQETWENTNYVAFVVPEPGQSALAVAALMSLVALRLRRSR